jgi:hypothetical protein
LKRRFFEHGFEGEEGISVELSGFVFLVGTMTCEREID